MGIRISKEIGYFLPKDKISLLLVDDYEDIIESLDSGDDDEKNFFAQLIIESKKFLEEKQDYFSGLALSQMVEDYENKKLHAYEIIKTVLFYDDFEGVLFSTNSMLKARRHDDLIDYYEDPNHESKVTFINRPIYPVIGYTYHGGLEAYDIYPELVAGQTYEAHISTIAYKINHLLYEDKYDTNYGSGISSILTTDGYFTPNIDETIYVMAKAANILKPEVTEEFFNKIIAPAIIQSWG